MNPDRRQPSGFVAPLPGQFPVGDTCPRQPQLGECGQNQPRPPVGLFGVAHVECTSDFERAFFSPLSSHVLDPLGYAPFQDWRLHSEEGLARRKAAVWSQYDSLTVAFGGEPLSLRRVELAARHRLRLRLARRTRW